MSYKKDQRKIAVSSRNDLFEDPGGGLFFDTAWEFVLKFPELNLHPTIRASAINYFRENNIAWWGEDKSKLSGHLLSSQIACLNHLFPIRNNKELALLILQGICPEIIEPVLIDNGYVGFEVIGAENYLGEKSHIRGEYSTSIDAVMVGQKPNGKSIIVLIEWKYTESYDIGENKYISSRAQIYDKLIENRDSPFHSLTPGVMYFEPFYQLMRQTLLGWKMVNAKEFNADEFMHIHIIPKGNKELLERNTSTVLIGKSMSGAWKRVLKKPKLYNVVEPERLLKPLVEIKPIRQWLKYLKTRYWNM